MKKEKKYRKIAKKWISGIRKILLCVLLLVILVNLIEPVFFKAPDASYEEELSHTEFESEVPGSEKILCIDDNTDALLWRLRMIGSAKKSITLATFDLRSDESGTDVMAALYQAAEKGVQVRILIDGIYQIAFGYGNEIFQALAAHDNIEVRIYNPIRVKNIFRLNYRMHDKYLIVDEKMYLLGGRNTNDIFLGGRTDGINIDRDILVYDTSGGNGKSLLELQDYFEQIWEEECVKSTKGRWDSASYSPQYKEFRERYAHLKQRYEEIEQFEGWEAATERANKITLLTNGTSAERKTPWMLQAVKHLTTKGKQVTIQTPYVICNQEMYRMLDSISEKAELKILLNAVEKGSNPWGCTDYLNQKKRILEAGADVYELMNEHAVHTKTILIDDRISVVGSYNLDMRSTYLDTELMLVIDSRQLNRHIREMDAVYMEKSREVKADGQETDGKLYREKVLTGGKKVFYAVLRVIIRPIRHLL